ncbi:Predicted transcriptional regulator [Cedecea davisae]|uniref:DNA-binding protein n=2 Tax=Cedecea davisae TaxID=158484 RepID=A0ABS6DGZ8_9ENTR|nr:addiction module antidote protein [Cedecea davisae]EPF20679.1 putative addiction module antidote protein [Cedecea davisae DSM 4568]MBU4682005.1 DNA-binding protein [Cedecea davisae]MBU4686141.1 DNA-binding protein [Cedecea davisae]SUX36532.1 Predicted transcriptional regulator [Cedecea davisae]
MAKSVLHDDAMVQLIKDDPAFAQVYLHQALIEIDEEGGYEAFMMALRHVIEASGGMSAVAKRAGVSRESLYKTLSPTGNPSFKSIRILASATGYPLSSIVKAVA